MNVNTFMNAKNELASQALFQFKAKAPYKKPPAVGHKANNKGFLESEAGR
jgi:hypothetical protein